MVFESVQRKKGTMIRLRIQITGELSASFSCWSVQPTEKGAGKTACGRRVREAVDAVAVDVAVDVDAVVVFLVAVAVAVVALDAASPALDRSLHSTGTQRLPGLMTEYRFIMP